MLPHYLHPIDVPYKEILRKGTIAIVTTFTAGLLFGKKNMMIAFVLVLGSSTLAQQNFRTKRLEKTLKLILIDEAIMVTAYIASLNKWGAIFINGVGLFLIIYLTLSPYDPLSYKTFMMLLVFCQYTKVSLGELPMRMLMILWTVSIIILTNEWHHRKENSLLPSQVASAFTHLGEQLTKVKAGGFDEAIYTKVNSEMRFLAYMIYKTSYRRYFTTYLGRIQFHLYLVISDLNVLISQLAVCYKKGDIRKEEVQALEEIFIALGSCLGKREEQGMPDWKLSQYLSRSHASEGIIKEIEEVLVILKECFKELDPLAYKRNHKIYRQWMKSDIGSLHHKLREHFSPQHMRFNFALRMSVTLTLLLLLGEILGYYKFIWVIIPIMSIAQPYQEDTKARRNDRVRSNLLAAVLLTCFLDMMTVPWAGSLLLVSAFYLLFAYNDYYHYSFFITIISMCISSVETGINVLLIYRIFYVLLGAAIVTLSSWLLPYGIEEGMQELMAEADNLNELMTRECVSCRQGRGNLQVIREGIIRSAILCEKLEIKNKQYGSDKIREWIAWNTEFTVRLGHYLLKQEKMELNKLNNDSIIRE